MSSQLRFELAHLRLGHLPLVVVRAVAVAAAFLILPLQVQAQVADGVVGLDAVTVVVSLPTNEAKL